MPVGTGEKPPVSALAEQGVPHAADCGRIDAGAAVSGAADGVESHRWRADRVATQVVLTAAVRRPMPGLAFEAEGHGRAGVVEVAQVLDVEAVVAGCIERAGSFQVGGHVIAAVGVKGRHPLDAFQRLGVAQGAVGAVEFGAGRVPVRRAGVQAAGHRAVPVVALEGVDVAGLRGEVAAAGVAAVAAVEAVRPHGQGVGVAQGGVAGRGGQRLRVDRGRYLARDDAHRRVLVAGHHRFQADEQRLVAQGRQVLHQRVLVGLDAFPTPHVLAGCRARNVAARLDRRHRVLPGRVGAKNAAARDGDQRVGRRGEGGVFSQRAVAVAGAAMAGLHEPVQAPGRGGIAVHRLGHLFLQ